MDSDWTTHVYAIPLRTRFRGITVREGMVLHGPNGWGEFCPFPEYHGREAGRWLAAALEQARGEWPAPVRDRVPVNCIVPAVDPQGAHDIAARSGCRTAKVKVADHPESLAEDLARVAAVRDALGPAGAIRVDANAAWDVDTAVDRIRRLDIAASGLEYVEQPCLDLDDLAAVRRRIGVRIAADESIRRADDPLDPAVVRRAREAADVAILKCTPLGGVRAALRVAEAVGLPCVVSSALETSVGLAAELALAAALPELEFACGLGTLALLDGDLVAEPDRLRPADGMLALPPAPPVPTQTLLDRYRHPDPDRTTWWTTRLATLTRHPE
ncbi:MAG: o-succinylbenzoate synthase [Mycobacteriaceae bacterium]|nr:o-succinylbenzoate synthase [Mycobacteriaceae bacterium]